MSGSLAEVDFWDVGQADCTAIKLSTGRLILIDVGLRGSPIVDWLNERRPAPQIEAIVLTHNDRDHAGALSSIIAEHKRRIGAVWMLLDRKVNDPKFQKIFRAAMQGEAEGLYAIQTLVAGQVIWQSDDTKTKLHVIHPGFSAHVLGLQTGRPNNASAVIVLEHNDKALCAWPGDLELRMCANALRDRRPELLMGPHHGGPSDFPTNSLRKKESREMVQARWAEIRGAAANLSPRISFISVGTKNNHSHPRPGYIRLVAQQKARVVCSQLTRCCDRMGVDYGIHVFKGSGALGLRPSRTGVSCRGSLRMKFNGSELLPDEFHEEHLRRVSTLLRPQCLHGAGWRKEHALPQFGQGD